jgi:hypothetical protein
VGALVPVELASAIEALVGDLAAGRFDAVENSGRAGRLTADDLSRGLAEYGRTLVSLPPDWQRFAERYDVRSTDIVAIDVTLWTAEEGRSDLTLQIEARRDGEDWSLAISDLRVL